MSKIEQIQTEIQKLKLSSEEVLQVREWLEDLLEDQLQLTDEFKAKVEGSLQDMKEGRYSRIRRSDDAE